MAELRLVHSKYRFFALHALALHASRVYSNRKRFRWLSGFGSKPRQMRFSRLLLGAMLCILQSGGLYAESSIDVEGLLKQEVRFLAIEHIFRLITQPSTRTGGTGLGSGYRSAVGSLHGWSDGDPFHVNYIGHPMQGAISGYIWQQNDKRYRAVRFGRSPEYWKAKLRATAFSLAHSEQFEIGPVSEASIGQIQKYYPQQGFVDHVITPALGLAWQLGEDSLDEYVVRWIERRTKRAWVRAAARTGLIPPPFANIIATRAPWHRDDRYGVTYGYGADRIIPAIQPELREISIFELAVTPRMEWYGDNVAAGCVGGGANAAFRLAPKWMFVVDVSGCKLIYIEDGRDGDSLTYVAGMRWTPVPKNRWSPYSQLLLGGNNITREPIDFIRPPANEERGTTTSSRDPSSAFTVQLGTGVDLRLNSALALRVAGLEYSQYFGSNRGGGIQFTSGFVLRVGTW